MPPCPVPVPVRLAVPSAAAAYTRDRPLRAQIPSRTAGVLVLATLTLTGCASSSVTRTETTLPSDEFGADVPVRVTATAVKPSLLHLYNGIRATFVNEDAVPRRLGVDAARSDSAGCSALALVLQPGERRTTPDLPRFAVCYFRDEQRPGDTAFQGAVVTH